MFLALHVVNFGMIEQPLNIEIYLWNFAGYVFSPKGHFLEGQTNDRYNLVNKGHPSAYLTISDGGHFESKIEDNIYHQFYFPFWPNLVIIYT